MNERTLVDTPVTTTESVVVQVRGRPGAALVLQSLHWLHFLHAMHGRRLQLTRSTPRSCCAY